MASIRARLRVQTVGSGAICGRILEALPEWFGIPESVAAHVAASDRLPTVIASVGERDVGILTWDVRTPFAAEVYVMGVLPDLHRQGVGRQLLDDVENSLAGDGIEFLQVKTLSSSKPDKGCERTRAFYFSCGFRPLEELPHLWDSENPALQMIKGIAST